MQMAECFERGFGGSQRSVKMVLSIRLAVYYSGSTFATPMLLIKSRIESCAESWHFMYRSSRNYSYEKRKIR
jgi:hypothetical protein